MINYVVTTCKYVRTINSFLSLETQQLTTSASSISPKTSSPLCHCAAGAADSQALMTPLRATTSGVAG